MISKLNKMKEILASFLYRFIVESGAFDIDADGTLWDWESDDNFVTFLQRYEIKEEFKKLTIEYEDPTPDEVQRIKDFEGRFIY